MLCTVGSWCSDLAQSTERWTIGTSITAMTPKTAARFARREKSVDSPRRSSSRVHHEHDRRGHEARFPVPPHAPGRLCPDRAGDQAEPVEHTPISADEDRDRVEDRRFLQSQATDARKTTTKARYASQAVGTCTYMIR